MSATKTKKVIIKKAKKTGRPVKYEGDKTLMKVLDFMDQCKVVVEREVRSESQTSTGYDVRYTLSSLPTKQRLARYLGISRSTLYEWEKKYSDFSDIVEELSYTYEEILIINGLSGRFNSKIVGLLLSSKFSYAEKKDHRVETAASLFGGDDEDE